MFSKRIHLPATLAVTALTALASADLLEIQPGFPLLAYNNLGTTSYNAATNEFSVASTPLSIRFTPETPPRPIFPTGPDDERFVALNILVDNDGNLVGGSNGPDLTIVGEVDADGDGTIDYAGTLLTGEILAFGFNDGPAEGATFSEEILGDLISGLMQQANEEQNASHLGTPGPGFADEFDFRFRLTGGSLAPLYASRDIGVTDTSEASTFETFMMDFDGGAKGFAGPIDPIGACCLPDATCAEGLSQQACEGQGGLFGGRESTCSTTECPGACCLPDENCESLTRTECADSDGQFQGEAVDCMDVDCTQPGGACCFPDGSCLELPQAECIDTGGSYQGTGSICVEGLCPQPKGACCFPSGACFSLTEEDCLNQGGAYVGDNEPCDPSPCTPPTGACCLDDGGCIIGTEEDCTAAGGLYEGDGTTCEPGLCDLPTGACCFPDGSCDELPQSVCIDEGGTYQGTGSECVPGLCPDPEGACCFPSSLCIIFTEEECVAQGGLYQGDNVPCDPGRCPDPEGACCIDDGACIMDTLEGCLELGGIYLGDETNCDPNLCPPTKGACCFDSGDCAVRTEEECDAQGGDYIGDETICFPNLCPDPTGACCFDNGTCLILTQDACVIQGGDYQGDDTACEPGLCPPKMGACCFDNGVCLVRGEDECNANGGTYQGDGTDCEPGLCDEPGACCLPDLSCAEMLESACIDAGGLFQGEGSICLTADCPRACCFVSGVCEILTGDDCSRDGGRSQDQGVGCDPNPCPQPGACCIENECLVIQENDCIESGGEFQGPGSECLPETCGEGDGACCFPDDDCSTGTFECSQKIVQMTMIWDGDAPVRIRAYDGPAGSELLADIDNIAVGDEVTIGPLDGPNNSEWEIFEAGTSNLIGISEFHRSCSDSEMDGPEDCGKRQGNGKSNESGLINDWILEGLVDGSGDSFDCGLGGGGSGECMVLSREDCEDAGGTFQGGGTTCDDVDCDDPVGACCLTDDDDCSDLTQFCCESAGGLYLGDDTSCATTKCFDCDGKIVEMTMIWDGDEPVRIRAYDGDVGDDLVADIDNIEIGDVVTVGPLSGPNDSYWQVFEAGTSNLIGLSKFHRSCSDNEMNGPEDCGNREGNGKSNESGLINDWLLEGLVDETGAELDCGNGGPAPLVVEEPGTHADVNGDQNVDVQDLLLLLRAWGVCATCPEDVNNDGSVNFADLLEVLMFQG